MPKITEQMRTWLGGFGKEYTDRNPLSLDDMEALYKRNYGITRTELNRLFLGEIDRSIKILEVGSGFGNQLLCLQKMGFEHLYGIELQNYAVQLSRSIANNMDIIEGSAFDIPCKDGYFDLVFTSGLLIHISPSDIAIGMKEIYRCSREYVWGFEYYSDKYAEITYREHTNLLWKANFAELYLGLFSDLEIVKEKRLKYLEGGNVDSMFLLRKRCSE